MTIAEQIINDYLSKGRYVWLDDVPEELKNKLNGEGWEQVLNYQLERSAHYQQADEEAARAEQAKAQETINTQKIGGNTMKVKESLGKIWRDYLDKVSSLNSQIDTTNKNIRLSPFGIKNQIDKLREQLQSLTLTTSQRMGHMALAAQSALEERYNSRSSQVPDGMTLGQYQQDLLNTLQLAKVTKDIVTEPEYESLVSMFKNDPLAVRAFNDIFNPDRPEQGFDSMKFMLPVPPNRADEYGQLANDLDKVLLLTEGRSMGDDPFNDLTFITEAINMRLESVPEVEMEYCGFVS